MQIQPAVVVSTLMVSAAPRHSLFVVPLAVIQSNLEDRPLGCPLLITATAASKWVNYKVVHLCPYLNPLCLVFPLEPRGQSSLRRPSFVSPFVSSHPHVGTDLCFCSAAVASGKSRFFAVLLALDLFGSYYRPQQLVSLEFALFILDLVTTAYLCSVRRSGYAPMHLVLNAAFSCDISGGYTPSTTGCHMPT